MPAPKHPKNSHTGAPPPAKPFEKGNPGAFKKGHKLQPKPHERARTGHPGKLPRALMRDMLDRTTDELIAIARSKTEPARKKMAALTVLRASTFMDLADYEPFLNGTMTLGQLRDRKIDTSIIKRVKVTRIGKGDSEKTNVHVEMNDWALEVYRVIENIEGKLPDKVDMNVSDDRPIEQIVAEARQHAVTARKAKEQAED